MTAKVMNTIKRHGNEMLMPMMVMNLRATASVESSSVPNSTAKFVKCVHDCANVKNGGGRRRESINHEGRR